MSCISNFIYNKKYLKKNFKNYLRINISLYKYFFIENPEIIKKKIKSLCHKLKIFGRIYISYEGINIQANILKKYFDIIKKKISNLHQDLKNIHINVGIDNSRISFNTLSVKIKKRIIFDGLDSFKLNKNFKNKYLNSQEVNNLLYNKEAIFIDMRNNYEHKIGHFKNAILMNTSIFREQLKKIFKYISKYKKKKIVLYCTGGIRCEKTSLWMQKNGYKNVYQIRGGIIGYINDCIKKNHSIHFLGKNFVFDLRLYETITEHILSYCNQCYRKSDYYVNCINNRCNILFIQCLFCSKIYRSFCSKKCYIEFHCK
ncbi:tRNA uridine(34) hydroxylase [Buchnera aphidicola (Chaitophorus sp. 3695)]|uniref:oxygen-dependent tRNA uridine(34) hydroxylase TrhO n=1 Tax=Buchnera aphidicola TaxID=9 RepID=UPI0034641CD6